MRSCGLSLQATGPGILKTNTPAARNRYQLLENTLERLSTTAPDRFEVIKLKSRIEQAASRTSDWPQKNILNSFEYLVESFLNLDNSSFKFLTSIRMLGSHLESGLSDYPLLKELRSGIVKQVKSPTLSILKKASQGASLLPEGLGTAASRLYCRYGADATRAADGTGLSPGRARWNTLTREAFRVLDAQGPVDFQRGSRAVEGVEMNSGNAVVDQIAHLFGGPVQAHPAKGFVVLGAAESLL